MDYYFSTSPNHLDDSGGDSRCFWCSIFSPVPGEVVSFSFFPFFLCVFPLLISILEVPLFVICSVLLSALQGQDRGLFSQLMNGSVSNDSSVYYVDVECLKV